MVDPVSTQDAVQCSSSHLRCLPVAENPRNEAEGRTTNHRSFAFRCTPVIQGAGQGGSLLGACAWWPYPQTAQQIPLSATFPILFHLWRINSMEHMGGCYFPVEGRSHFWVANFAEPRLLLPGAPSMCRRGSWWNMASAFPRMGTMGFGKSTSDTAWLASFTLLFSSVICHLMKKVFWLSPSHRLTMGSKHAGHLK